MIQFDVNDMSCGHCVASITKAVRAIDAQAAVEADLGAHRVRIDSTCPASHLEQAIRDAGFTPQSVHA